MINFLSFSDELVKISKSMSDDRAESAAIGSGALLGGAYLGTKAKPRLTGRETLFHGTTPENAARIRKEGLLSANKAGTRGITDILGDLSNEARSHAYAHTQRGGAVGYSEQAKLIAKGKPLGFPMQLEGALRSLNPVKRFLPNKGIVEMNVPTWKKEIADQLTRNPEAGKDFKSFMYKAVGGGGMDPFTAAAAYHDLTANTRTFKEGIPTTFIKNSPNYSKLTIKEVGEFAKANKGRFGAGAALAAGAVGLGAFGLHQLRQAYRDGK